MSQRPTCSLLRINTPAEAVIVFHAVHLGLLPIVQRRLDTEARRLIRSGDVFVWEERCPGTDSNGHGIERWTDGIRWGPSRVRDDFLYYQEKGPDAVDIDIRPTYANSLPSFQNSERAIWRENLIKQTYSVYVNGPTQMRKWHLIAYFTRNSLDRLHTVGEDQHLRSIRVPEGMYPAARAPRTNRTNRRSFSVSLGHEVSPHEAPSHSYSYSPSFDHPPPEPEDPSPPSTPRTSSTRSSSSEPLQLPPLRYTGRPPSRRHPIDELQLMSLNIQL